MQKKFTVDLTQEQVNYLQRLGSEVDGKVFLIDRMFANHATDEDTTMFDSVPFKHFLKEYEQAQFAWDMAKKELQDNYLTDKVREVTGRDDVTFNWNIPNYASLKCEITVL